MANKIGLITIATGKYDVFIPGLFHSFKKKFVPSFESDLIVLTDSKDFEDEERLIILEVPHTDWPMSTLLRFDYFDRYKELLSTYDCLYFIDCDMVFNMTIDEDIIPNEHTRYVGTIHPGFYNNITQATFETLETSTAFVPKKERITYYQACFFGALCDDFLLMSKTLKENIETDLKNNIIAVWHDESHVNCYFSKQNVIKLNPGYAYPEEWKLPFEKKIIHLAKNHSEIRK